MLEALGVGVATAIAPVHGGADTAIWRIERDAETYALRVFRSEQAAICQIEVAAMDGAAAAGLPVPRVHAVGSWHDRPALLLSWCPGRPLLDELRARPWRVWALGAIAGRTQAAIHAVSAPPDLHRESRDWIAWAGPEELPLQERLRALGPRTDVLLHLDYHLLNVMTDGIRVTGVLDWANARSGDPRADFARTVAILRLAPAPPDRPPGPAVLRRALELGWHHGYGQAAGPPEELAPFYAWAGAVMVRDLSPRTERPDGWLRPHHLEPARRWTTAWKRRAGLPA